MKHSIKYKLPILIIVIMTVAIALTSTFGTAFIEKYYISHKKDVIVDVYNKMAQVVYIGSFIGSVVFTFLCTYGHVYTLFNGQLATNLLSTAVSKCNISFTDAIIKGIFCNILVCVAVFMTFMAESAASKIICLFFPIIVFVICAFEHSVANMSYISGGLFINQMYGNYGLDVTGLSWWNFIVKNLLPVTIGNIIGGVGIGVLYWYSNLYTPKQK